MAVCVQLTTVYAFNSTATSTAAANRVVKSDILQAVAIPPAGLEACPYVALTGTEFGNFKPNPFDTMTQEGLLGLLGAAAAFLALAFILRKIGDMFGGR